MVNKNTPLMTSSKTYSISAFGTRFKVKTGGKRSKWKIHHRRNPRGNITVQLANPYHVEGDVVYGQVVVQATHFCPIGNISVKAEGYEHAQWETERTEWEGEGEHRRAVKVRDHHEGGRDFFKMKFHLGYIQGLQAGQQMVFPFAFQLPSDLTGTYYEKKKPHGFTREFKAKVKFQLKVKCDDNEDLREKVPLVIQEKPSAVAVQQWVNHSATVMLFCCIPRGVVHMRAMFDKNFYVPGETANLIVDCNNQSQSNVQRLNMKLLKVLTLTSKHRHSTTNHEVVAQTSYDGVNSGDKIEGRHCSLPIPVGIGTSTHGKHVHCRYELDVESAIDYAPDIKLRIPVSIFFPSAQSFQQHQQQAPAAGYAPPASGYTPPAPAQTGNYHQLPGVPPYGYPPAQQQQQQQGYVPPPQQQQQQGYVPPPQQQQQQQQGYTPVPPPQQQ
eukprot:CAMPEP_0175139210 /NCGR_PEP_ID=MMETSP0087-20121206/10774_1 /TAXON_ID=136419 /ORGANISM="Unknown Unknown, Strain D1" /LENGTH=440 /DNA_ID=CAMNT_0016422191 /DNA_START=24 /DNA_END=1346 /DNA_ORIENTATION=-